MKETSFEKRDNLFAVSGKEKRGPDGDRRTAEQGTPFHEDLPTTLARVEMEMIVVALRAARGNKARAARALGISERLMGLRVKKYRLNPKAYRTNR